MSPEEEQEPQQDCNPSHLMTMPQAVGTENKNPIFLGLLDPLKKFFLDPIYPFGIS